MLWIPFVLSKLLKDQGFQIGKSGVTGHHVLHDRESVNGSIGLLTIEIGAITLTSNHDLAR
jgi:hypothetical protein